MNLNPDYADLFLISLIHSQHKQDYDDVIARSIRRPKGAECTEAIP